MRLGGYFLVSIIRVIITVIVSTFFFIRFFIHLLFLTECRATCFKNSFYTFSKSGRENVYNWFDCLFQGGSLVSIETEEEWQFINHEIQKRGTSNTSAWHIGLRKRGGVWTWESGKKLNISKWRDSEPDGNGTCTEISKNGGLFNGIPCSYKNAFICEMPGGKITFQP